MRRQDKFVRAAFLLSFALAMCHSIASAQAPTNGKRILFKPAPSAVDAATLQELKRPIDMELRGTPLSELPAELAKRASKVSFRLDKAELKKANKGTDVPLNGNYDRTPIEEILWPLLSKYGLDYVVDNGAVVITTRHYANTHIVKRTYDISGISQTPATTKALWIDISKTSIGPDWSDMGGFATATIDDPKHITVRHTQSAHARVVKLFEQRLNKDKSP